eukprot:1180397-Prorocentrum_minimum.AAC.1
MPAGEACSLARLSISRNIGQAPVYGGLLGLIGAYLEEQRPGSRLRSPDFRVRWLGSIRSVVGQYNFADAWKYLQRHVPGSVFQLASERWDGGVAGALLAGGEDAFLELTSAVRANKQ